MLTFLESTDQWMEFGVIFTFWLLWIMLLWTFVYKSLYEYMSSILEYIPRSGIGGLHDNSITFWRTTKLLSIEAISFYIHTSNVQAFQFLHILINTCSFLFKKIYSHPIVCEVLSHCGLALHFLNGKWFWASFHELFGHCLFQTFIHF